MPDTSRLFPVTAEAVARTRTDAAAYAASYARSLADPDGFWRDQVARLDWVTPPATMGNWSWDPVDIKWFEDGVLNASVNCLDRHLAAHGDTVAIVWEADDPAAAVRRLTYRELHGEVCRMANILVGLGVGRGDRVTIYLPMIPEAAVAMLACARIGAVHSVVFAGFSPEAIANRIDDAGSQFVITADSGNRGGKPVALKSAVDKALEQCPLVEAVLVVRHTGIAVAMHPERDHWWHELRDQVPATCAPEPMGAEDPLFLLYTSGSTGKPKGVLHTTAGYLLWVNLTFETVFDYRAGELFWCTADVGWVTGHSYIVYGPLSNGATVLMFEGVPTWPDVDRFWATIARHKVDIFYTAPTALRALMRDGDAPVERHDLSSLRLLGSVGEPINPEAWLWYHRVVGKSRLPIVDTWWQTETGGILIAPLPGATALKPGSATVPFYGIVPALVDAQGKFVEGRGGGQSGADAQLARTGAHGVRRSRALRADLFHRLSGVVFHRRRRAPRRRRLLVDHRARRRRHQRQWPPHGHRRGRERAGRAPRCRRGRGGRLSARHQGPGHLRLCDAQHRRRGVGQIAHRTQVQRSRAYRRDCLTGPSPHHPGAAQDAVGQDHAADSAQDRRE